MKTDALFDPIFAQLGRVMDLRVEQHAKHSANLANANTPNYRARELDFSEVLEEVMEQPSARMKMTSTSDRHLGGLTGIQAQPEVIVHEPAPWALDGNSVDAEQEQVKMMENNLMFDTVARVTERKLRLLKDVVEESGR